MDPVPVLLAIPLVGCLAILVEVIAKFVRKAES